MDGVVVEGDSVSVSSNNRIHTRQAATLVRIRAGRAANKRRSWHAARVADDIQRSLADQSPVTKARSEVWQPNDDWSTSYHTESGWATASNRELRLSGSAVSGSEQLQVGPPSSSPSLWTPPAQTSGVSFSIASWVDRPPLILGMDNTNVVSRSKQPSQSERLRHFLWPEHAETANSNDGSVDASSDDDDARVFSRVAPARLVPVILRSTEPISPTITGGEEEEDDDESQHRRISSSSSNNFIDVVVKELRGLFLTL